MEDIDFRECRFIKEEMRFLTYNDFCDNKKTIRIFYNHLTEDGKTFFKWYVYSNIHMNEVYKNAIWSYLNYYDENGFELMRLKRFYKAR